MAPIFGRKKEPKEIFEENMKKADELWESPKLWKSSEYKKLLKHIEKAQEIAETAKGDQEDVVRLWSMKGSVYYMGYHKLDEALECYDKALSLNPRGSQSYSSRLEYGTRVNKLQVLFMMRKGDEFIKDFDKVLELIPEMRGEKITAISGSPVETWDQEQSRLWAQKGVALGANAKWRDAIDSCDKAIELDPKNTEAWHIKGMSLMELGTVEEALRCFDRALEINPRDWASLNEKGLALYYFGRYDEARAWIDDSLEHGPKGPGSRFETQQFGSRNVPKDVGTLLNKVRVLGTIAGRDLYNLSKQKPEEWAQKEREVEKMHEEIESCLARAIHLNPYEFLSNIAKVGKDWKSRKGLKVLYTECSVCRQNGPPALVTVAPLYFGKKRKGWGSFRGPTCPHTKRKFIDGGIGYSASVVGISKKLEYQILDPLEDVHRLEDELVELKEQLDKGVISEEEYEQKEKKLMEEFGE